MDRAAGFVVGRIEGVTMNAFPQMLRRQLKDAIERAIVVGRPE
jgi:hypothetical protein